MTRASATLSNLTNVPDALGHFGPYGGTYVPETLIFALQQLDAEYARAKADPQFQQDFQDYLRDYVGRPSRLYFARHLTEKLGGAQITRRWQCRARNFGWMNLNTSRFGPSTRR